MRVQVQIDIDYCEREVEREIQDNTKKKNDEEANDVKLSIGLDLESHQVKKLIYNQTRYGTSGVWMTSQWWSEQSWTTREVPDSVVYKAKLDGNKDYGGIVSKVIRRQG